jgi:MtN3 and saliva related transmembrane protein
MIEFIGYIAAFLTSFSFVFQAILIIKTNDTKAISLKMYATFSMGVFFWLIYGILIASWPMAIANFVTISFAGYILIRKIKDLKND